MQKIRQLLTLNKLTYTAYECSTHITTVHKKAQFVRKNKFTLPY